MHKALDLDIVGQYAYVTTGEGGDLELIDVSWPNYLYPSSRIDGPGEITAVDVDQGVAYLRDPGRAADRQHRRSGAA